MSKTPTGRPRGRPRKIRPKVLKPMASSPMWPLLGRDLQAQLIAYVEKGTTPTSGMLYHALRNNLAGCVMQADREEILKIAPLVKLMWDDHRFPQGAHGTERAFTNWRRCGGLLGLQMLMKTIEPLPGAARIMGIENGS